jgi:hypothetical protein
MKRMIVHGGNTRGRFQTPFVLGAMNPQKTKWHWEFTVAPALPRGRWVHVAVTKEGTTVRDWLRSYM